MALVVVVKRLWYPAIALPFGLVLIRERDYGVQIVEHELIHVKQHKELLWFPLPYIVYTIEFLCKLLWYRSAKKAYYAVSFEREAQIGSQLVDYHKIRKNYTFAKFIIYNKMAETFNFNDPEETFNAIYDLEVGAVFKYTANEESLLLRIEQDLPETLEEFKVRIIPPGADLYSLYGPNHAIVSSRKLA